MVRRCAHRIRELTGPRRAVLTPLCTHAPIIFFGPKLGLINFARLHNAQFLSTYRSVRLHNLFTCMENRIDYFFERKLDGNAPISVRVIATSGITHGRKTVSPSRNPCDSDPFLVATHNRCSPSWDPHRLFFFGPELERIRINGDISPVRFLIYRRASACC